MDSAVTSAVKIRRSGCQPVLDLEIWDAVEVTDVGGHHGQSPGQRDRGDAQVGLVQPPALGLKARPKRPVDFRGPLVEGKHQQGADDESSAVLACHYRRQATQQP
jgi:hypothetical protein